MSEINSPLGRRQIASQTPRIINIPDETETLMNPTVDPTPLPKKVVEDFDVARKTAQDARRRVSPAAKERIEFLIGLGRAKKDVTFEDVVFSLQSLRSGEMREVLLAGSQGETRAEAMFQIRANTLAYAIEKIDGNPIAMVLGDESVAARIDLISNMDEELIEFLHDSYNEMLRKNKAKFAVESDAQAKEVGQDLKK
jgi:hypothetical protein